MHVGTDKPETTDQAETAGETRRMRGGPINIDEATLAEKRKLPRLEDTIMAQLVHLCELGDLAAVARSNVAHVHSQFDSWQGVGGGPELLAAERQTGQIINLASAVTKALEELADAEAGVATRVCELDPALYAGLDVLRSRHDRLKFMPARSLLELLVGHAVDCADSADVAAMLAERMSQRAEHETQTAPKPGARRHTAHLSALASYDAKKAGVQVSDPTDGGAVATDAPVADEVSGDADPERIRVEVQLVGEGDRSGGELSEFILECPAFILKSDSAALERDLTLLVNHYAKRAIDAQRRGLVPGNGASPAPTPAKAADAVPAKAVSVAARIRELTDAVSRDMAAMMADFERSFSQSAQSLCESIRRVNAQREELAAANGT